LVKFGRRAVRMALSTIKHPPGASAEPIRAGWPAFLAGACAVILYLRTLAPGLTWAHHGADGGDLLAAALTHGVPHPPGYPTYQLLLRLALRLFGGEPAWAGNLLSACCAALAVALLTDLTRRTLADHPPGVQQAAALAAGLLWATSPGLWSQAVITEVYALNALAVVAVLWLAWRGAQLETHLGRSGGAWLTAAGLIAGLGLGNHLTLALLLPGLAVWFYLANQQISKSANQQIGKSANRQIGDIPGRRQGPGLQWKLPLAAFLLGVSVYAYLPWAARQTPPVNWGDPSTPGGFWWVVSASIYRPLAFGVPLADLPHRLAAWGTAAGGQFGGGPWGMVLALLGLWRLEQANRRWWWATTLIALAYTAYGIGYNSIDSYVYLIPTWGSACLWAGHGLAWLATQLAAGRRARWGVVVATLCVLTVGLPAASAARWWPDMDLSRDRAAQTFLAEVERTAAPDAIILVGGDDATFSLWYGLYGLQQRPDLTPVNVHLYDYPWYQASLLRQHPALAAFTRAGKLPPVEQFVVAAARRGPLYRADALAGFATGLRVEGVGGLVRLMLP
jgi:hypothetical protein